MRRFSMLGTSMVTLLICSACASSSGRSVEEAAIFRAAPACAFAPVGEVTATVRVRGGRPEAERQLHTLLARAAARRNADAIMSIEIPDPERLPFSTGRSVMDAPEVEWSGTAQAIRFADPQCTG